MTTSLSMGATVLKTTFGKEVHTREVENFLEFLGIIIAEPKRMSNFAVADRYAEAPVWGQAWRDADILKSVYSALFLGYLKPGKFQSQSRMQQTVDALWICIKPSAAGA